MFDGFLMSITNKLKKISASLDLYEGKFDEISTDVGTVNTAVSSVETKVDTVQTTSDEIKSLISSEVNSAKTDILAQLSSGGGLTGCIKSVQSGQISVENTEWASKNFYANKTITSVDTSKTFVICTGWGKHNTNSCSVDTSDSDTIVEYALDYKLTSATNLRVAPSGCLSSTGGKNSGIEIHATYYVVEFY